MKKLLYNFGIILLLFHTIISPVEALGGRYRHYAASSSSDSDNDPPYYYSSVHNTAPPPPGVHVNYGAVSRPSTSSQPPVRTASQRAAQVEHARAGITPLSSPHSASPRIARTPDHVSPDRRPPPSMGSSPSHVSTPEHMRSPSPSRSTSPAPSKKGLKKVVGKLKGLLTGEKSSSSRGGKDDPAPPRSRSSPRGSTHSHSGVVFHGRG